MTWIIDGRKFAKKVIAASGSSYELDANEATRKLCPACRSAIGNDGALQQEWPGLPAGVKFDPNDIELLEHLAGKLGKGNAKAHPFIDEFIPTLEGDTGICYTHPEKLPGVNRDGRSSHFFHTPANAYTKGTRKRRKVTTGEDEEGGETRWHKTGKTRPVFDNGVLVGWKKIMVLYTNFKKSPKPSKTNWVMHQYHLGGQEEEREGELVVSKVFYQTQPRGSKKAGASDDEDDRAENMTNLNILTEACVEGPRTASRPVPSTPDTLVRPLASREPRLVAEAHQAAVQAEVSLSVRTPDCTLSTISGPGVEEEAEAGSRLPVPNDPLDGLEFLHCDEHLDNGDPLLTDSQIESFQELANDCWLPVDDQLQANLAADFAEFPAAQEIQTPYPAVQDIQPPYPAFQPPPLPEISVNSQEPQMSSQDWLDIFLKSSQEAGDSQSGTL